MVNICHIYWFYPPAAIGGIETFIQSVSTELTKRKHNVTVVTGSYGLESAKENGVDIIRNKLFERYSSEESMTFEQESYELLKKIIEEKKIEIIHVHNLHFKYNFSRTLAIYRVAHDLRIPLILHVHGPPSDSVSEFIISKMSWDRIACVSKWVATKVYEKGVRGDLINAVYNGTNTEWFKPGPKDKALLKEMGISDKYVIGTPARLISSNGAIVERKGYFQILKALSKVKENRDDFVWILTGGRFPNKEWMEKAKRKMYDYARIYGIEENVKIGVEIPHDKMPAFYNSIDLMLMPSVDEPFGLSTIEAMSCGKVAIGANSGATTEIIRNEIDGFMVQPDNHIQLAELILKIMSDEKLSKNIGINARRTVIERFSLQALVKSLEKMYEEMIEG